LVVTLTSAPALVRTRMTSARPNAAANVSAVSPFTASLALTLAPWAISVETASGLPAAAASISGVVPLVVGALASAPALVNVSIIAASPFLLAISSGV
jgi:hypothetical protein